MVRLHGRSLPVAELIDLNPGPILSAALFFFFCKDEMFMGLGETGEIAVSGPPAACLCAVALSVLSLIHCSYISLFKTFTYVPMPFY